MTKTLTLIDALEQRLALIVGVAAVAFSATDPSGLSPKWAAIIAAAVAVSHVLAPAAPVAPVAAVVPVAPTDAAVNAELP
jgi:hypothetical protein